VTTCPLLNPLRRDGTSQRQRMPPALAPGFVQVDERGTAERLLYARELARLLRYYNLANEPAGDWAEFIERDVSTLAARIGSHDVQAPRLAFESARAVAMAADATTFKAAYSALFPPLFAAAETFEGWRRGSIEGMLLRSTLDRLIGSVLADALQDALRYARRAVQLSVPVTIPDPTAFGEIWGDLGVPADASLLVSGGVGSAEERKEAVELMRLAFERFSETARRVVAAAPAYLEDTLLHHPWHRPHVALFLAFLELLGEARSALNTLTARHLDFYYREVLRLVPRPAVADRVHVIFELAKSFDRFHLDKDTALNAGKDAHGVPVVFGTDAQLVANRARIDPLHGLKTVFVDLDAEGVVRNVHAAPDADSADGLGAPIEGDEPRWPTFGATSMPYARIGFAVASPMLRLAEGTRTVTLHFDIEANSDILRGRSQAQVELELLWNVIVQVSGRKGWMDAKVVFVKLLATGTAPFVEYVVEIAPDAAPVVELDPKLHGEAFDTRYPVLRFTLDNRGLPAELLGSGRPQIPDYSDDTEHFAQHALVRFEDRIYQAKNTIDHPGLRPDSHLDEWQRIEHAYPYKYFAGMRLRKLDLQVAVAGMRSVLLENDLGLLNPAKPFPPFGPMPRIGASFLVGSPEVFQKRLTRLTLTLVWAGYPEAGFPSHYTGYDRPEGGAIVSGNDHFKADVEVLKNGGWVAKQTGVALFQTEPGGSTPAASRVLDLSFDAAAGELPRNPRAEPFQRFTAGLDRGFVRLKLGTSFLHEMFPVLLAAFAKSNQITPPNPPHTPTLAGLTLDYRARETLDYASWKREDVENRIERIFQIGPFGQNEIVPAPAAAAVAGVMLQNTLVPEFRFDSAAGSSTGAAEGTLYLGIGAAAPPENLALLFQMAEGSEDPMLPAQAINWSYLTDAGWADFQRADIVSDSTDQLVASGIVQFALPKTATDAGTMLPPGLRWLRATVQARSGAVPKAIAVHTQAVRASFRDHGNDPSRLAVPLPAGTISKLVSREAAVKSVAQPYASFGGRMAEGDPAFGVRVAERLRHKRRAVTIFDYERLVLDRFPEVYKLRCINHTDALCEYAPGAVRLAVVPNLRNRNAVDPLRPRLALAKLNAIQRYVAAAASDFASIEVANPDYEEVRVRFNVRFLPGFDKGFYTGHLEQEIIRFLTPWAYEDSVDLSFGGRVHRSAILNFIDERDYVDFVTDFEMDHVVGSQVFVNVEQAVATRSTSVLVSAHRHEIGDEIVSCEDHGAAGAPPGTAATTPPPHPPPSDVVDLEGERYLGNVHTRELHDLQKIAPGCQIDEISIDRRYFFSRIEDSQALGYDLCAYCFGRAASKR
jgi:hypothetical protein